MRVAITGASGLIGNALAQSLGRDGHDVLRLVRGEPRAPKADDVRWSPEAGYVDLERLEGVDAVVHLAGAGVGDRPWTPGYRRTIRESRARGTAAIASALVQLGARPRALISASAIGYYGNRDDTELDEDAPPGEGFLAEVVVAWEQAADPARNAGIRVVHPRSGLVITNQGGLLPRMLIPFRLGLGGKVGDGRQWWSGISLADEVSALRFLLDHEELEGPVNLVAPGPARNADWTRMIGELLHRPTALAAPRLAIRAVDRLLAGQGSEMLLFSQRVRPARLQAAGYPFQHPDVESILRSAIG